MCRMAPEVVIELESFGLPFAYAEDRAEAGALVLALRRNEGV